MSAKSTSDSTSQTQRQNHPHDTSSKPTFPRFRAVGYPGSPFRGVSTTVNRASRCSGRSKAAGPLRRGGKRADLPASRRTSAAALACRKSDPAHGWCPEPSDQRQDNRSPTTPTRRISHILAMPPATVAKMIGGKTARIDDDEAFGMMSARTQHLFKPTLQGVHRIGLNHRPQSPVTKQDLPAGRLRYIAYATR